MKFVKDGLKQAKSLFYQEFILLESGNDKERFCLNNTNRVSQKPADTSIIIPALQLTLPNNTFLG